MSLPKISSKYFNINPFQKNSSDAAILIQGPIKDNIKFLNETIKIYKKNFPKTTPQAFVVAINVSDTTSFKKIKGNLI